MEVNQENWIQELEDQPTAVDQLIEQRRICQNQNDFEHSRSFLFAWSVVFGVVFIALMYYLSPYSRINTLSVSGLNYVNQEYVVELSGIHYDSRFFLVFPGRTKRKLEEDPFIKTAKIVALQDRAIQIEIEENQPYGYRYEEDQPMILFVNDKKKELTSDLMPIISRIPYINGFFDEQQSHLLSRALSQVDRSMIEEISEIYQYDLGYDNEVMAVQMRDGGTLFTNYFTTSLLNRYYEISMKQINKNQCIFALESERIAYAKSCPWDEVQMEYEYWLDEDGNVIKNRWGDPAIKHYYRDDAGLFYLDDYGNYIIIPIDSGGNDMRDEDFLEHYLAGYYANGYLELPEELWVEEEENPTPETE